MDNTPLDRLKDIAAGGRAKTEKPMVLKTPGNEDDTLELRTESIVEDAEFEEMEGEETTGKAVAGAIEESGDDTAETSSIELPNATGPIESSSSEGEGAPMDETAGEETVPAESTTTAPAAEIPMPIAAPQNETAAEPEGDINDLVSGKLLPHVSLPIAKAGNYDVMNEMLKKGKVNLGEVNGAPHIILTADALDDIIDEKKNDARSTVESIEKTENEISELETRIETLKEERGSLLDAAAISRDEISKLQNLRSGLK